MNLPYSDEHYFSLADNQAMVSRCLRRKVGAVVVDRYGNVIGTGYNDAQDGKRFCDAGDCPRGQLSLLDCPSYADGNHDMSNCIAVHAEVEALTKALKSGVILRHLTLFTTAEPCRDCGEYIGWWTTQYDPHLIVKYRVAA